MYYLQVTSSQLCNHGEWYVRWPLYALLRSIFVRQRTREKWKGERSTEVWKSEMPVLWISRTWLGKREGYRTTWRITPDRRTTDLPLFWKKIQLSQPHITPYASYFPFRIRIQVMAKEISLFKCIAAQTIHFIAYLLWLKCWVHCLGAI